MNFMPIFQSLFTLGLISGVGIISRKTNIFKADDAKVLSGFVYHFGLPALFLVKIARFDATALEASLVWGSLLPPLIVLLSLILLRLLRVISKDLLAILGITVVFGSNAFFGVPFFESLYGSWGLENAVVTAAILGTFGIVVSQFLFSYATHKGNFLSLLLNVARSPLIISVLLGVVFSVLKLEVPVLFDALELIGKTTSGTAIFVLGMFICDNFSFAVIKKAFAFTLARVLLLPVVTYLVILLLRSPHSQLNSFLLMQSGIPAAVSTGIMAERFNYKPRELTGVVILSSLFSFFLLLTLYAISAAVF